PFRDGPRSGSRLLTCEGADDVPRPMGDRDPAGRPRSVALARPGNRRPGLLADRGGVKRSVRGPRPSREDAWPPRARRPEPAGQAVVHPRASEIQPSVTPCLPQVPIARYPRAVSWAWSSPAFIVITLLESSDHVTTHLPSNPPRPLRLHSHR